MTRLAIIVVVEIPVIVLATVIVNMLVRLVVGHPPLPDVEIIVVAS